MDGQIVVIKTDSTGTTSCDSLNSLPSAIIPPVQVIPNYQNIHIASYANVPYPRAVGMSYNDSNFVQMDICLIAGNVNITSGKYSFTISPNPTAGELKISSLAFADKNSLIEIFNTLGEKIYSAVYNDGLTVNCELFPPGIFFVRLSDFEKQLTQKLIVE